MYIKRHIDNYLLDWKNTSDRKPLLLRGARQVGKTTAIKHLGEQFEYFIEANFEKQKDLKSLFELGLPIKEVANRIGIIYDTPVVPGKTLLFLDEIQVCPEAIHSLWLFKEDYPELHVVAAGSLLEFALKGLHSYGVGRIRSLFMYPFSFDEFLEAQGKVSWLEKKRDATCEKPLFDELHNQLVEQFRSYLMVGGMPASVVTWIKHGDYVLCQEELSDIAQSYFDDFSKYSTKIAPRILRLTFQSVIQQIGKKFVYSHVEGNYRTEQIKEALDLLCDAGLVYRVQYTAANGLPLGAEINLKFNKYIVLDTGLLLTLLNNSAGSNILASADVVSATAADLVNKGSLTEMVAGCELIKYARSNIKQELYYWENLSKNASSEVDYILSRDMKIVPLEVKAGTSGKMKSLRHFMEKKQLSYAIRSSLENFARLENNGIDIIPLYALSNLFRN
jgi:predicted AAA+ superfamily ATPase